MYVCVCVYGTVFCQFSNYKNVLLSQKLQHFFLHWRMLKRGLSQKRENPLIFISVNIVNLHGSVYSYICVRTCIYIYIYICVYIYMCVCVCVC